MTYTPQQRKGWKHENQTRAHLLEIGGEIDRAPQSGAYTGDPDLKWTLGCMVLTIDCKYGKDWIAKRHRARLKKAQVCVDRSAHEKPIILMELETFKRFAEEMAVLGVKCSLAIKDGEAA